MSVWSDVGQFLSQIATDGFSAIVERIKTVFAENAEARRRVAFSVAIIALSAKMAKADGVVTEDEVSAFREIFDVPPDELKNVARLYNLARQDIAGFDAYARQVRSLFPGDETGDDDVLHDVLDALFHIAKSDGVLHEAELLFIEEIAVIFGLDQHAFKRLEARHIHGQRSNPYTVLDVEPDWPYERIRKAYLKRVAESHPDRLIARGVPAEFVKIANDRLAAINAAFEEIELAHPRRVVEPVPV